ncbi:hypothetical protein RHMOL_Rhmol06G0157100 [Rhododendron molle]|uniref:Uncharacterized protein n=1 Tax=Rhododendron molle TaxID=49168 RepID=A0ACC0ND04_RHOML|nr:hypothetical protein RHMOL_Rhmol06G0157100 [Rhododendron molle]
MISPEKCPSMLIWSSRTIDKSSSLKEASEVISKVAFQAWHIWKERNDFVFNHLEREVLEQIDVAIPLGRDKGTAAMVVRNEVGELVDGSTTTFPVSSVLHGELEAIRRACYMVEGLKVSPVTIELNSRRAIELSVSELVPPWEVFEVVMDIRKMIQQKNLKMEWVKRSGSKIAHQVAAWASKGQLHHAWISNPSVSLLSLLYSDVFNSDM